MIKLPRVNVLGAWLVLLVATTTLAGCQGGGSTLNSPPTPNVPPTPPPTSTPSNGSGPVSTTIPFSDIGNEVSLPMVDSIKPKITLPPNSLSNTTDTFAITVADHPFGGLPVFGYSNRHPILYAAVNSATAVILSGAPAFQVTLPTKYLGLYSYGISFYDPTNPGAGNGGWQQISWLTHDINDPRGFLKFPGSAIPFSMSANTQYGLALFYCTCD